MKLKLWQVDAFASRPFEGNPAAIVPLETWLPDEMLQAIALENNLSATAYFIRKGEGEYDLRWFTPATEVDLCGHATLASAFVIFSEIVPDLNKVTFSTRSGALQVSKRDDGLLSLSLPASTCVAIVHNENLAKNLGAALGVEPPIEIHDSNFLLAVWSNSDAVRAIRPTVEMAPILREAGHYGLIACAASNDMPYDFVSRVFAPDKGILEDPVTGSAHCALTPFWAKRLNKKTLRAFQASPRGGDILCTDDGARTTLSGNCALYMRGEIEV
jgi:PhzF family phenazine biosynthesis protein